MANTRIKDLSNTATNVASDAFIAIDGNANGTEKISRDNLRQDTADALAAAPSTYNLAPLTSGSVDVDKGGTGSTTVDGAKTNLEIPSVGTAANEVPVNGMLGDLAFQSSAGVVVDDLTVDGDLIAAVGKPMPVNGPTMRFDGGDDEIRFTASVGSPFSFTNGTDDTAFAVAGWCKLASGWNTDQRTLLSKFDSSTSLREWRVYIDSNYRIYSEKRGNGSISGNSNLLRTISNALSDIDDKWIHICVVYPPAGPNSADAFTDAKAYIYVNGKLNVDVQSEQPSGPYVGMTDTAGDVRIGSRQSHDYWDGEIRDVKLFNKELSAAEVKEVYSNGQLGFAESTGTIAYVSDFSSGVDGFVTYGGTGVGNIDGIGGKNDNLRFTIDSASANHQFLKNFDSLIEDGKSVRVSAEIYIPSSNAQITGVQVNSDGTANVDVIDTATATNAWTTVSGVFTKDYPEIRFRALVGTAAVFVGNGSDVFYIRNVRITQIGSVLDARAEQFDTSTGKLYDLSGNSFVGTQSGGVELRGKNFPVYETGTWTPTLSFGGGSTGVLYSTQEGYYTRIGNIVRVGGRFIITSKGSDAGVARVNGLPFTVANTGGLFTAIGQTFSKNMGALTSGVSLQFDPNTTTASFFDTTSTGSLDVDNTNFTNTSDIRFSATYQIQ